MVTADITTRTLLHLVKTLANKIEIILILIKRRIILILALLAISLKLTPDTPCITLLITLISTQNFTPIDLHLGLNNFINTDQP